MNAGGTVTQISDSDFREPSAVAWCDQYLIFTEAKSGRWFCSDLNDETSYDSTFFATAESNTDNAVGLISDHGQVIIAGEQSMEIWENVGGSGFPFQHVSNGTIELGCAAGQSLAKMDNIIFWLASDLTVRRLAGVTPVRVSTHGAEDAIRSYGDPANAYGMSYSFGGHLCYVLTFPSFGTWVYDATTNQWHERQTLGSPHWKAVGIVQANDLVYVLSEDGDLGYFDTTSYSEWGDPQRMQFTTGPIYGDGRRVFMSEVELAVRS